MGDGNVFNTFSFNKWADTKKEEEIDKESRRRRNHQITRLKERLVKERQIREATAGDGDMDMDALIEALQKGEEINSEKGLHVEAVGEDGENGQAAPPPLTTETQNKQPLPPPPPRPVEAREIQPENRRTSYPERKDDDILKEIRMYQATHLGPPGTAGGVDSRFWRYNRRYNDLLEEEKEAEREEEERKGKERKEKEKKRRESLDKRDLNFKYNRYVTRNS